MKKSKMRESPLLLTLAMIAAAETTLQVEITVQLLTLKATSRNCHLPSNSSTPIQTSL